MKKEIIFNWINEWRQLFGKYNWTTWNLITVEFENDIMLGGYDLTVIFLGFGFCLRVNHKETETMKEIIKRANDITKTNI